MERLAPVGTHRARSMDRVVAGNRKNGVGEQRDDSPVDNAPGCLALLAAPLELPGALSYPLYYCECHLPRPAVVFVSQPLASHHGKRSPPPSVRGP